MRFMKYLCMALLLGFVVGCSRGPEDNPVDVNAPGPTESIRATLEDIIETGEPLGSGGYTIQTQIEAIKAEDPAKAAALQPLYDEIITINDASKLKAKAKEMLDIL